MSKSDFDTQFGSGDGLPIENPHRSPVAHYLLEVTARVVGNQGEPSHLLCGFKRPQC